MNAEPTRNGEQMGWLPHLPATVWERTGITEHLGGRRATERLLAMRPLPPDAAVLEIGCGTGDTACYLARRFRARVLGLDLLMPNVLRARRRVASQNLVEQVNLLRADAQQLPCPPDAFDLVLAESVLVFGDGKQMAREAHRVLKPGGVLAINELTLRAPPPERLSSMLNDLFGIPARQEGEWRDLLAQAGFPSLISGVYPLKLEEQVLNHLRVDGMRTYLAALRTSVANSRLRTQFFNREMLLAAFRFLPYVGYGLYSGCKRS
jgi:SAM-dependent methyltransferase